MSTILDDARLKAAAMFTYFSDVLEKDVHDKDGVFLGRVWDVSAKLGETYPKIDELIIERGFFKRTYANVPWAQVARMDESDIVLAVGSGALSFGPEPKTYEFLIRRDMLDQQVVDTYNHKVRRVNDVHLLKVDHDLVIAHVDIGMRGLIRRLGWQGWMDLLVHIMAPKSKYFKDSDLVSWKFVQPVAINPASMTMKLSVPEKQLSSIPAADLGDIIFDLSPAQRMTIFRSLDTKTKAKVFENLEFDEQKAILKELDKKDAAQIVALMSSDDAADLLERLPRGTVKNLMALIETTRAKKLSSLLGYSSDSAGGLMTTELVSLSETMTVAEAIEFIKIGTKDFEIVPYIYIVDDKSHLKGVTTVRRLLMTDPKEEVSKATFPKTLHVYLDNGVKEVAYMMDKYKMSAIPVIDENKVLHGVISVDDILGQVIAIAWRKRPSKPKGL